MTIYSLQYYLDLLKEKDILISVTYDNEEDLARDVENITFNSKEAVPATLFVCKGENFKLAYLKDAVLHGIIGIVTDEEMIKRLGAEFNEFMKEHKDIALILVSNLKRAMAILGEAFYNRPSKSLKLIGITGTKGKSTTAYFTRGILDEDALEDGEMPTGFISSVESFDGEITEESHLTTPEAIDLQKTFNKMKNLGLKRVVMEASSQGLKYDRLYNIQFDIGVFLNLGEDHISPREHPDWQDYHDAKIKFMSICKIMIVNLDDEYSEEFLQAAKESPVTEKIITFSAKGNKTADVYAVPLIEENMSGKRNRTKGQTFMLSANIDGIKCVKKMSIAIGGDFNISNAVAACCIAMELGIPVNTWAKGIKEVRVPGRMEEFYIPSKDVTVVIDYAHNRISYNALFDSVEKDFKKEEISIVFGCAGNKALDRRTVLTGIAARRAGRVFITEEDNFDEPLESIIKEVSDNVLKAGGNLTVIPDRNTAFRTAIEEAPKGGVVIITGKGRETELRRGNEYITYPSDYSVVMDFLAQEEKFK